MRWPEELFVFGLMGFVVFLFLLSYFISWLTNLPAIGWFVIIAFIITAIILTKRHINRLRKLKEAEQRRLRLERKRNLDDLKKMLPSTFEQRLNLHHLTQLFMLFQKIRKQLQAFNLLIRW